MNIAETIAFDKQGNAERGGLLRKLFLSLVILLVSLLSFGIGRLTSAPAGQGIRIEYDPALTNSSQTASVAQALPTQGGSTVVVSKSGSKYHYPHCPGAKQIKEANKISFPSAQAAEAAGYTLAANCQPR